MLTKFSVLLCTFAASFAQAANWQFDNWFHDPSLVGAGTVLADNMNSSQSQAWAGALQTDGKSLIAGRCVNAGVSQMCVLRLDRGGLLDVGFGTAGRVLLSNSASSAHEAAHAVAVQADGRVVLAGICEQAGDASLNRFKVCLKRLNANGSIDNSFSSPNALPPYWGSKANTGGQLALGIQAVASSLFVAYECGVAEGNTCVSKLNASGGFDLSFGAVPGAVNVVTTGQTFTYRAMALSSNGQLLLAGRCEAVVSALQTFCALKFTQLGALDASFGAAGVATTWPGGMGSRLANVMAVTATDQILLAGDCNDYHGGQLNCVAALSPAGARDLTYGNVVGDGFTFIDLGSTPNITALSVMSDGRLLVGNRCNQGVSSAYCVMRLDATGQIDNDFGTFAKITAQMNNAVVSSGGLSLVAETTEGTVLLLGGCAYNQVTPGNSRFCATRYWDSARTYVGCSLDIDGDGKLLGTTDGLLLSRALAGVSGPALVANAVNSAGSRLSYQAVEQFISQRCGLRLQAPFVNHSTSACHFDLNPVPDQRVNQADLLTILRGLFNQKGASAVAVPGTAAQATARLQACGWTGSF